MPTPIRDRRLDAARDYILRDEFDGQRAAGGVNNTAAEPGTGTRQIVDTAGNLHSISGGKLVFSGRTGTGDPGYWLTNPVTRLAGRLITMHMNLDHVNNRAEIGFDNNLAGASTSNTFYQDGGALTINPVGLSTISLTAARDYYLAIVLKSVGAYFFLKEAVGYPYWTLIYAESTDNDDPLYAAIGIRTGWSTGNNVHDYIRVPRELWLPTPAAYDTFTRANGALGNSEVAGPDGQQVAARAWTNQVGTTLVAGNAAQASALVGGIAIATVDTGHLNVVLSSTLTRSGNEIGVVLRYADSSNYIRAYHDGTNVKLDKIVGGGVTNVISAVQAYAAGAVIVVICSGTSFSLYYNNAQIGATSTVADAALQTGTLQGTYSTNTGNTQDNFQVFPRGTGGEYEYLNNF